ncbi:MAG: ATP-binding protein, partial [Actinocrinis sp.]
MSTSALGMDDDALTDLSTALFGPDPAAVGPARSFVRAIVGKWGGAAVVDDAVLIASELVTNAIVHAGMPAEVTCALLRDGRGAAASVRVAVADRHPSRSIPTPRLGWDDDAEESEGGRGLYLSAQIAASWGVQYTRDSKQIWFVLDLEPDALPPSAHPEPGDVSSIGALPHDTALGDTASIPAARTVSTPRPSSPQRATIEDLDDYLELTAEKIKALLDADGAFVLLAEDGGLDSGLRLRAESGLPPGMPQVTAPPSAAGRIGLTGLPAVYPDLAGPSDHGTPLIR